MARQTKPESTKDKAKTQSVKGARATHVIVDEVADRDQPAEGLEHRSIRARFGRKE
ncbi:hypothetical protein [Sphaerisporangium siamense]|uniref:Uncharacterized protein n=1 Tax=Sphaerisporangium siamense TaxID=795645 RepID=A0A7W7D9W9_9ACTN|nr:hypothetical protein [Sphaerisporangium siamense]MBB4702959.1 hypothetical protein [Sphaerisporangium siamense]